MAGLPANLRIRYRSEDEVNAELGPLFLRIIAGGETTHASVDRLFVTLDEMLARWPAIGVLVIVEHGTPKPGPDIRTRVDAELRRLSDRVVMGYAFLGLGYWGVDARQFGIARAAAIGAPVCVEISLARLAEWVGRELIGVNPEVVVTTCEELRAELLLSRASRR